MEVVVEVLVDLVVKEIEKGNESWVEERNDEFVMISIYSLEDEVVVVGKDETML